jgi:DNA-binding CsgD family transcriptional regulator
MSNVIDLKGRKAKKAATMSRPTPRSAKKAATKAAAKRRTVPAKAPRVTRATELEALLRRADGATTAEIAEAMKVQEHTARALISVNRRKFAWVISLAKKRYRIVR